jgi:pyrimidine deaminase RibD-like protein
MIDSEPPSKRINRFFAIAAKLAQKSDGNHKHGCLVIKGGAIVGKACNNYFNGQHAECAALSKQWKSEIRGATLIVVRIRKDREYGLSKPCHTCEKFIKECGIRAVYYSTNDPNNYIFKEIY